MPVPDLQRVPASFDPATCDTLRRQHSGCNDASVQSNSSPIDHSLSHQNKDYKDSIVHSVKSGGEEGGAPSSNDNVDAGGVSENDLAQNQRTPRSDSQTGNAQYLTANCVLVTYYSGDLAQVVDEHFSRALSDKIKGNNS